MMNNTTRRVFFIQVASGASALAATHAMAQAAAPMASETDPVSIRLAYAADSAKVDAKKHPKHTKDQLCSNCQLYTGKPKEVAGPCPLFAGKQVAAKGWCNAWVKKAA